MLSVKKAQGRNCFSEGDLCALSDLMNNGFSFQDALSVSLTPKNQNVIHSVKVQLEQGKQGEQILVQYLNHQYQGYFKGFIQYMNMKDTLSTVLSIMQAEKKQKEELIKGMLYPSLLFIGVNIGVVIFNSSILPVMTNMMSSFQYENTSVTLVQNIISVISMITLLSLTIAAAVLFYCLQPSHLVSTYCLIQKRHPQSLIVKYASADFSRFYLECVKRKIATRKSLLILKGLKQKPLVQYIASQLDASLNAGIALNEALETSTVEEPLVKIFHIAVFASNCQAMMEGYLKMVSERTKREIQIYTKIVQCISYSAAALIIVLVYQVLLMPISMMQTL